MRGKEMRVVFLALTLMSAGCLNPGRVHRSVEPASAAIHVETVARGTQSWNGAPLPPYPSGDPEITILRITIPPGARLDRHCHPVINAGFLVRGELTVETDAGQRLSLHAGEGLIEVVNTCHFGINEGNAPAEIIVFYAGTTGMPLTVKAER